MAWGDHPSTAHMNDSNLRPNKLFFGFSFFGAGLLCRSERWLLGIRRAEQGWSITWDGSKILKKGEHSRNWYQRSPTIHYHMKRECYKRCVTGRRFGRIHLFRHIPPGLQMRPKSVAKSGQRFQTSQIAANTRHQQENMNHAKAERLKVAPHRYCHGHFWKTAWAKVVHQTTPTPTL